MENSALELNIGTSEKELSRVELENQLSVLEEELKQTKKRTSEFYDIDLYNAYKEALMHFRGNEDAVRLALRAEGVDYEEAKNNLDAVKNFEETHISPITEQILHLKKQIRIFDSKKFEGEEEVRRIEQQKKFQEDKKELEDMLYAMLEKVYLEIPDEAKASGMTNEAAIKVYKPELEYVISAIEMYIGLVEDITYASELHRKKEQIFNEINNRPFLKKYTQVESKEADFLDVKIENLAMSLNLQNIIVKRLGMQTLREFTQKYSSNELKGISWWNPKATTELNTLFVENGKPPYIV